MSVSFDDSPTDEGPIAFDLTPLIDVTFQLIIFWMVVTSMAPSESVRDLDLPRAAVSQAAGGGRPINIDVTGEAVRPIYLAGQAYSPAELSGHLADRPLAGRAVVLRADRKADSALISRVARDCYRHGAGSVAFSLRAAD